MFVYFFPIVGAVFSDWLFGKYRTILWLSIVYCLGHGVLALMDLQIGLDQRTLLWWGLAFIAIGAGGIKPCVSSHVGDQFGRANEHLLPRIFSWFYFSINLGAAASTLLTPILRDRLGPSWAFGVPGILMALATLVFWLGRNKFVHVPPSGNRLFTETFSRDGLRAIGNLIPLYLLITMFWALFDQTASRWVLQAENMNRNLFGYELSADQIQAANPLMIMILIPIFSYGIYPLLGKFFTVTPLRKIGMGIFITLPAFALPAWIQSQIDAGQSPHIGWQILSYLIITSAEVMVSITSLEFSYTQAPNKMKSFIMGMYLLSIALGNLFTASVNDLIAHAEKTGTPLLQGASYYWFFTGCTAIAAVLYVIWAPFYRGKTFIQSDAETPEPEPQPE
jgi:POT family proton-dependent oligopeptide transporter